MVDIIPRCKGSDYIIYIIYIYMNVNVNIPYEDDIMGKNSSHSWNWYEKKGTSELNLFQNYKGQLYT